MEEEGGSASFHDSVGDFGDFEVGGDGFRDDLEFILGFESVQEVLVIAVGHRCSLDSTRLRGVVLLWVGQFSEKNENWFSGFIAFFACVRGS